MANLKTSFAGIILKNPIVVASSPLSENIEGIQKCEDYGAGAVITKSCSSTRLNEQHFRRCYINQRGFWAASGFDREIQDVYETLDYLSLAISKTAMPVIASVSELSLNVEDWLKTCNLVKQTGVAGIQLDLFYFENIFDDAAFKDKLVNLFSILIKELNIPIIPKLNINLPSLYMKKIFADSGITNISLLDSVSLPSPISIEGGISQCLKNSKNVHKASLFGAWQFPLTLKYLYDVYDERLSICAGGGINQTEDIIQLIMYGATTVQIATHIILNGYSSIQKFIEGIEEYLDDLNISNLADIRGSAINNLSKTVEYTKNIPSWHKDECINCNRCVEQSFCFSIQKNDDNIIINKERCESCSLCVNLCPSGALKL